MAGGAPRERSPFSLRPPRTRILAAPPAPVTFIEYDGHEPTSSFTRGGYIYTKKPLPIEVKEPLSPNAGHGYGITRHPSAVPRPRGRPNARCLAQVSDQAGGC